MTTNLLVDRLFGEGGRRTKVIPCFGSEGSCFMLAFASLITASRRWHFVRVTPEICWDLGIHSGDSFHAHGRATPKDLVVVYDAK